MVEKIYPNKYFAIEVYNDPENYDYQYVKCINGCTYLYTKDYGATSEKKYVITAVWSNKGEPWQQYDYYHDYLKEYYE